MSFIDSNLLQTCVYWGNPVPDGFGGFSFDAPLELSCRWEYRDTIFVDSTGEERKSFSCVYVTSDLDENGFLYLGSLYDLDSDADPEQLKNCYRIASIQKYPSLKNTFMYYKVLL